MLQHTFVYFFSRKVPKRAEGKQSEVLSNSKRYIIKLYNHHVLRHPYCVNPKCKNHVVVFGTGEKNHYMKSR